MAVWNSSTDVWNSSTAAWNSSAGIELVQSASDTTTSAFTLRVKIDLANAASDTTDVSVDTTPDAGDVKHAIKKAFKRNAKLDADELTVESSNGTITIKGTVGSWSEHDEAIDAAWAAPGVHHVHDRILVLN